jgi:hypothetical protein
VLITKGVPENHASQFEANINPGTTYECKQGPFVKHEVDGILNVEKK